MERKKMNSYDFKNQVAVVTGGANGIGYSVAERLSKSGAIVKIWDLDIEVARKAAETIKSREKLIFVLLFQKLQINNEVNNNSEADNSKGSAKKAAYLGDEPCDSKDQLRP